jgi:hypothetical protein
MGISSVASFQWNENGGCVTKIQDLRAISGK